MSYVRKTTRKEYRYGLETLRAMANCAAETSLHAASVEFGCNWNTIRRACDITGIAPKRRPSNALAKARALRLRAEGKTYTAIAHAVGYNRQSVHNWCSDAGVLVDCRRKAA